MTEWDKQAHEPENKVQQAWRMARTHALDLRTVPGTNSSVARGTSDTSTVSRSGGGR